MKKKNRRSKINKAKKAAMRSKDPNWDVPRTIPSNMRYTVTVMYWGDEPLDYPEYDKHQYLTFEDAVRATRSGEFAGIPSDKITVEPKE